jgi:hypothetical protein
MTYGLIIRFGVVLRLFLDVEKGKPNCWESRRLKIWKQRRSVFEDLSLLHFMTIC